MPSSLQKYVAAQDGVYESALAELQAGKKRSHWMWFMFPHIEGLSVSEIGKKYELRDVHEARLYIDHDILGGRLLKATNMVLSHANKLEHKNRSAFEIFGSPDEYKFHASMTLFFRIAPDKSPFEKAINAFFDGEEHTDTIIRI